MAEDTPRIFICSLISVKKVVPSALLGEPDGTTLPDYEASASQNSPAGKCG